MNPVTAPRIVPVFTIGCVRSRKESLTHAPHFSARKSFAIQRIDSTPFKVPMADIKPPVQNCNFDRIWVGALCWAIVIHWELGATDNVNSLRNSFAVEVGVFVNFNVIDSLHKVHLLVGLERFEFRLVNADSGHLNLRDDLFNLDVIRECFDLLGNQGSLFICWQGWQDKVRVLFRCLNLGQTNRHVHNWVFFFRSRIVRDWRQWLDELFFPHRRRRHVDCSRHCMFLLMARFLVIRPSKHLSSTRCCQFVLRMRLFGKQHCRC
mmetsp:Transcript_20285/g.43875  ORF Transcript_20285/g.43875 Transcript_20285/m.43875 type:complete len:264 (+) Transcript_20285:1881-2672(+)